MEDKVIEFIAKFTGINAEQISLLTLVNGELGIDGDDGREFMLAFSNKFDVDINDIDVVYFGPEVSAFYWLVGWPYILLKRMLGCKATKYSPLSVKKLVKSAEAGVWDSNI